MRESTFENPTMLCSSTFLNRCFSKGVSVLSVALAFIGPVAAAERVNFRIGEFERSIKVSDLQTFARTGTLTPDLSAYLTGLRPSDQQAFRTAITQTAPVDTLAVSQFLSTPLGHLTLQQLTKVLDQPQQITEPALSSALIVGTAQSGRLQLLDVLKAYPLPTVTVKVPAVISLMRQLSLQFNLQNNIFQRLLGLNRGVQASRPHSSSSLAALAKPGTQPFIAKPLSFQPPSGPVVSAIVLLPTTGKKVPLVVLAPGLNTDFNALLYIGRHLASHGYAVATLNFPFTSADEVSAELKGLATIPDPNAWLAQPMTVSALIDVVASRWGHSVDTNNVGLLGQSLGGYTVLALAGSRLDWPGLQKRCQALVDPNLVVLNPAIIWQCQAPTEKATKTDYTDSRVRSVIAVNPVTSPIFSSTSFQSMQEPVLILAGTDDFFAPPLSQQLNLFTALKPKDHVLGVLNHGTHLSFLAGTGKLPSFITGPDRKLAKEELRGLSLVFFDSHLRGGTGMHQLVPPHGGIVVGKEPLRLLLQRQLNLTQLEQVAPGARSLPMISE